MQLSKLISLREGHRKVIDAQFGKISEEMSTSQINRLLDILAEKADALKSLNEKIVNHADTSDVVGEMLEAENYSIDLEMKLQSVRDELDARCGTDRQPIQSSTTTVDEPDHEPTSGNTSANAWVPNNQSQVSHNFITPHTVMSHHTLPKLTLPTFDGDSTHWQTFWDSFESSVHNNATLSDVQKFTYLRSLLQDAAARCVEGFPLTNANYRVAIDLLRERFGQPHKIISRYMQSLLEIPRPYNSIISLRMFHDKMETHVRGLESLGECEQTYGSLLVPIVMEKLPPEVRRNMAREHGDRRWTLTELRKGLSKEIGIMEAGMDAHTNTENHATATFFTNSGKRLTPTVLSKNLLRAQKCPFCSGHHSPLDCTKMTTVKARINTVKQNNLCYNCLGNHRVAFCRSKHSCRHCHRKHHSSLCEQLDKTLNPNAAPFVQKTPSITQKPDAAVLHSTSHEHQSVLLKTAIAPVCYKHTTVEAQILFDEGAQRSFITEQLAAHLQLPLSNTEVINLASFGDSQQRVRRVPSATVHLVANSGQKISINVLVVPTIAVPLQDLQKTVTSFPYLKGLKLAHPVTSNELFEIEMLVGADAYWDVVQDKIVRGNGPTAVQSKIGYLLSGPLSTPRQMTGPTSQILHVMTSPPETFDIENFWKLESLGISSDDTDRTSTDFLKTYQDQCISLTDGRYTAKLPWKEEHPTLPSNYDITRKRAVSTIRRLSKEPELLRKYDDVITEQERRGFIERVDTAVVSENPVHYISHHGVKNESSTTPIRIVYDCSCRQTHDSPSLNDCLQSTPPDLNDLTGILMRFRLQKYAVSTDIEKAFLHVRLHEADRDVTRFLWLSDPMDVNSPLQTYRFKSVLFGATCSPFILILVMAKTRVSPVRQLTLPRLELMAAVIGSRLAKHVSRECDVTDVTYWSDSQIVLHWLQRNNYNKSVPRFVANRVQEIQKLTDQRKWHYCPTDNNPADLLTRGITSDEFKNSSLWINGPTWINHKTNWPKWEHDVASILTTSAIDHDVGSQGPMTSQSCSSGIHTVINVSIFSELNKLLRVTAYVQRFIYNCRVSQEDRKHGPITVQDMRSAEMEWIRSCQNAAYTPEIESMKLGKCRLPLIKQLSLYLEDNEYVRCRGRIHNAPLSELARFPYLLPGGHHFTRLIINDAHKRLQHSGSTSVITYLRQKYWIPQIRRSVQTQLRKCIPCRKVIGKPYTIPDPPPLPSSRVTDSVPFKVTGVDYTGSLIVRGESGASSKAYICLFTCASTRAVHLELVPDLSEDSFIQAFRRFCSRKSLPRLMISDNATTFVAASQHIKALFQSSTVQQTLSNHGTDWQFIPKGAPWYGGWWERLVGLTKTTLKKTLGRSYVSYTTLQTIITEIEASINDRPITYVASDPMDIEPLTPAHLLYGRRITTPPYQELPRDTDVRWSDDHTRISKHNRDLQRIIKNFRERWAKEYLTGLREYHTTTGKNIQTLKVGDVVQIQDEGPRLRWRLAVIQELNRGNDGLVRSVKLRTNTGFTNRPIKKLYPLEIIQSDI